MPLSFGLVHGTNNQVIPLRCDASGRLITVLVELSDTGVPLPIDSLAKSYSYNGDGTISYIQVVHDTVTYRQTFTYLSGTLSAISKWVAQ